jgi:hypothetical protein
VSLAHFSLRARFDELYHPLGFDRRDGRTDVLRDDVAAVQQRAAM